MSGIVAGMTVVEHENPYPVGPEGPIYLTTQEVADRFRVSQSSVRSWRQRGEGPLGVSFGSRVLYPLPAVEAWEQEQLEAAGIGSEAVTSRERLPDSGRALGRRRAGEGAQPAAHSIAVRQVAVAEVGRLIAEALAGLLATIPPPARVTDDHERPDAEPRYLNTADVAARLAVTTSALHEWKSTGTGPPWVKFGGRVLYPIDELYRWEVAQRSAATIEHTRRGSGFIHDRADRAQKL